MAKLKILSSNSSGNAYILESEGEILLIELGINFKDIVKSLKYEEGLKRVRGCLTSHC